MGGPPVGGEPPLVVGKAGCIRGINGVNGVNGVDGVGGWTHFSFFIFHFSVLISLLLFFYLDFFLYFCKMRGGALGALMGLIELEI